MNFTELIECNFGILSRFTEFSKYSESHLGKTQSFPFYVVILVNRFQSFRVND